MVNVKEKMKILSNYITVLLTILVFTSCTVGRGSGIFPPAADTSAQPSLSIDDDGSDHKILVANGLSENATLLERTSGIWNITQNIFQTGISPNQMILHNGLCYIVNSLSNSIQVVDPSSFATVREISTGPGTSPNFIAFADETTLLVSCYQTNEVLLADISSIPDLTQYVYGSIPMPDSENLPHDDSVTTYARPGGIMVVNNRAFVVCSNLEGIHMAGGPGLLVEIDIDNLEIENTIELTGRDTTQVLHSPRFPDRLIVMSAGDYSISEGFIGNGIVESIDLNTGGIFQVVEVDGAPFGGVIGPEDILYIENGKESDVLRVDLRAGIELESFHLLEYGISLSYASSLVALPGLILATNFNSDLLSLIDPLTGEILAELQTGDGPDAMVLIY